MPLYGITAIRIDPNSGRITHARMGPVNGGDREWIGPQRVVEAREVVVRLVAGDTVYSLHTVEGGHTIPGARARRVVFVNGAEGFDTLDPENHPGRTVRDLPLM